MALAALRPCLEPRCAALVSTGRCATHTRQQEQRRGSAYQRGYTKQWARASTVWLQAHPLCGQRQDGERYPEHSACTHDGRLVPATCTDHIRPHQGNGALFWDQGNWQGLCASCHARKTVTEDGGFGR